MSGWAQFDKVFVICCLKYKDRFNSLMEELDRVNVPHSKIQLIMDVNPPWLAEMHKVVKSSDTWLKRDINRFKTVYAHYQIWKITTELNYNRVLLLEDDARFLKDTAKLDELLLKSPDSDVVLYDKFAGGIHKVQARDCLKTAKQNGFAYVKNDSQCDWWSSACYSISHHAADVFTNYSEKVSLNAPDNLWNHDMTKSNLNIAIATTNLAVQKQFSTTTSPSNKNLKSFYQADKTDLSLYNI